MKILFINSSGFYRKTDGLYIYHETASLLVELNKRFEINAYHYELPNWSTDNLANFNLSNTKVEISTEKRRKYKALSYISAYFTLFFKILKTDCLYLFYPNSFRFSILYSVLLNRKFALYVRGEKGLNSVFSKYIFKKAHFILTVSPEFTKSILPMNKKVFTIKPMISYNENDIVEVKERSNIHRLLYVGRIEKDKGSLELIKAVEKLINNGVDCFILTMVGNGELLSYLKSYVKDKKIEQNVIFKGAIYNSNELKKVYQNNDIFVLPSHHEGFPRVLYEAMIFKLTIITTFVGTISNLMEDQNNCLKIKVNDFNDISNKLQMLFNNDLLSESISLNGTTSIKKYLIENNKSHLELVKENFRNEK